MRQIMVWMSDAASITVLDFILSQQDRVGDIAFVERWYSVADAQLKSRNAAAKGKEKEPLPERAFLLKRSHLNHNDRGGRVGYSNVKESTGMLVDPPHVPVKTCRQLVALSADLRSGEPPDTCLKASFELSDLPFAHPVKDTMPAADVPRMQCNARMIRFDLNAEHFLLSGSPSEEAAECGAQ